MSAISKRPAKGGGFHALWFDKQRKTRDLRKWFMEIDTDLPSFQDNAQATCYIWLPATSGYQKKKFCSVLLW